MHCELSFSSDFANLVCGLTSVSSSIGWLWLADGQLSDIIGKCRLVSHASLHLLVVLVPLDIGDGISTDDVRLEDGFLGRHNRKVLHCLFENGCFTNQRSLDLDWLRRIGRFALSGFVLGSDAEFVVRALVETGYDDGEVFDGVALVEADPLGGALESVLDDVVEDRGSSVTLGRRPCEAHWGVLDVAHQRDIGLARNIYKV